MSVEVCALCKCEDSLVLGHVMPRFAYAKLIGGGKNRILSMANRKIVSKSTHEKMRMMCRTCDNQIISKYENWAAKNMGSLLSGSGVVSFSEEAFSMMSRFALSVMWRTYLRDPSLGSFGSFLPAVEQSLLAGTPLPSSLTFMFFRSPFRNCFSTPSMSPMSGGNLHFFSMLGMDFYCLVGVSSSEELKTLSEKKMLLPYPDSRGWADAFLSDLTQSQVCGAAKKYVSPENLALFR